MIACIKAPNNLMREEHVVLHITCCTSVSIIINLDLRLVLLCALIIKNKIRN